MDELEPRACAQTSAEADRTDLDRIDLGIDAEPGEGGLTLVPYFEGERTPNLPDATAALSGMTLSSTTRPNLTRAAVGGGCCAASLQECRRSATSASRSSAHC